MSGFFLVHLAFFFGHSRCTTSFQCSSMALPLMSTFSALQVTVLPWSDGFGVKRSTDTVTLPLSSTYAQWYEICNMQKVKFLLSFQNITFPGKRKKKVKYCVVRFP